MLGLHAHSGSPTSCPGALPMTILSQPLLLLGPAGWGEHSRPAADARREKRSTRWLTSAAAADRSAGRKCCSATCSARSGKLYRVLGGRDSAAQSTSCRGGQPPIVCLDPLSGTRMQVDLGSTQIRIDLALLARTLVCPTTAFREELPYLRVAAIRSTHRQRPPQRASGHGRRRPPGAARTAAPARPRPHATGSCWAAGGRWGWRSSACTATPQHPAFPGRKTVSHTRQVDCMRQVHAGLRAACGDGAAVRAQRHLGILRSQGARLSATLDRLFRRGPSLACSLPQCPSPSSQGGLGNT